MTTGSTDELAETDPTRRLATPLAGGRTLVVTSDGRRVELIISTAEDAELALEIRVEASGPVISLRGASIEVRDSKRIALTCDEFVVQARERIALETEGSLTQRSGGDTRIQGRDVAVEASPGAVRVKANDDVQLLGELVLLNCDRQPPIPAWVPAPAPPAPPLPLEPASGDRPLIDELTR
jgi:hypothetical protein